MSGYCLSDVVYDGIDFNDIKMLYYFFDEDICCVGVIGLFFGYFEKWDSKWNIDLCLLLGWNKNLDGFVEGVYNDIENFDCKWIGGFYDYMKYIKYGYGCVMD